jgi:UDP-N-acetyl-D-galactosamine dehydrogenase
MTATQSMEAFRNRTAPIAVVGLGYVGLPLALCLSRHFTVIGFDIDAGKVDELRNGHDRNHEVDEATLRACTIAFTTDQKDIGRAGLVIIAVPTPVDNAKRPDFAPLIGASTLVGRNLLRGALVVYESTVYPGATEEVCIPVLEKHSGMRAGVDFGYGYSPERVNPGDKQRTVEKITKVVSANDGPSLELIASVYGAAIPAGVYRAASIRVAEAAKVIENTQRDLNIALVNELALIFHRLGIDTLEVLEAAGTKWNFLPFRPGLVGGHCIGVDPYYLTHKAEACGYRPEVILAGRRINDNMGHFVAQECIRMLANQGCQLKHAKVLILGLTFKENCSDVRNSKVIDIIDELKRFGAQPIVNDPLANPAEALAEYGVELAAPGQHAPFDAVIAAVGHRQFLSLPIDGIARWCRAGAPFLDVKSLFDRQALAKAGFEVWRL